MPERKVSSQVRPTPEQAEIPGWLEARWNQPMPTGDLVEFDIVLPEEAIQALMRYTRAKTPEEAVERCIKLLPGRKPERK